MSSGFFYRQRENIANCLGQKSIYWKISPLTYANYRVLTASVGEYIRGKTLDAGAGNLTARPVILQYADSYVAMDVSEKHDEVDVIDDIQVLSNFENESLDTLYSAQVLEHVPKPWEAFRQIHRVLKKGGYGIVTVPHLSALHEEPHDFYRFTPYSLMFLPENVGLKCIKIERMGGLISFVVHPVSMLIVLLCWPIPCFRWVAFWANFTLLVAPAVFLDKILNLEKKFPANLLVVVQK